MYQRKVTVFVTIIIAFLFVQKASATYLAGDVYVYENGRARVNVETDIPLNIEGLTFQNEKITGITEELVNKKSSTWTFSLSLNKYDDILLDIHLPNNLKNIIQIQGNDNIIDIENKIITIIDEGELNFSVSYTLKETQNYSWLFWPLILIFIVASYLSYKRSQKRREHLNHVLPFINDQEKKILDILMRYPQRQKEMRKKLGIPKASFSRYLINLEKKRLIVREGEGRNKIIKLK